MADDGQERKPQELDFSMSVQNPEDSSAQLAAQQAGRKASQEASHEPELSPPPPRPGIFPSNPGKPLKIRAPHGSDSFEISWIDGAVHRLSNRVLRGFCPCAGCQGHSGEVRFNEGNAELRDIKAVGNYAVELTWGDGHSSGIYSFEYIYRLAVLIEQQGELALIEQEVLPRAPVVRASF